jgi:hypothetical protein
MSSPTTMMDESFIKQFKEFIDGHTSKPRKYHEITGDYIYMMLSDTTRLDMVDLRSLVRTIDIVKVEVLDVSMHRRGIFKSSLEAMLNTMRSYKKEHNWKYIFVQCLHHKGLMGWLKKRTDVVWKEIHGASDIWIDLYRTTPLLVSDKDATDPV